jgi:hypothetical protein
MRNLAVDIVAERRTGVISWLDILARLARIGIPFHFIRSELNLFGAPGAPARNVARISLADSYLPPAWYAAGVLIH